MAVNLDTPYRWKEDTQASVDHYNKWFMKFAPKAFRETRIQVTKSVEQAILDSNDMRDLSPDLLLSRPGLLPTLRMSCCPPLAVDRLVGLAYTGKNVVRRIEGGKPPTRMNAANWDTELSRICRVISTLLDREIFPWLDGAKDPTDHERHQASMIVADRLCSAVAKDTMRTAQKTQQLSVLSVYLDSRGYREIVAPGRRHYSQDEPATYTFFVSVPAAMGTDALLPIDAVVQPIEPRVDGLPVLIQTESQGSFAESSRHKSSHHRTVSALRTTYGQDVPFALLLGGYFGGDYLGTQAAEGIDWVWQHRITDLQALGV
jgi:hypothetical protein